MSDITISKALELFWDLAGDLVRKKSPDQKRRWRNPRIKAVKNFIALIGDKEISQITRDDALEFRSWWLDRIEYEGLIPNSANKDLGFLNGVLNMVNDLKRLHLDLPFDGLRVKEGESVPRPPFSTPWIRDKILADGALDGLNLEARVVLITMINTGARPSEISSLYRQHIQLDCEYPHISIEVAEKELKTINSRRKIPLVGCSLEAMKQCPDGFPRYWDKPSLSATTNKYLRAQLETY